jgi:hypothetical protein
MAALRLQPEGHLAQPQPGLADASRELRVFGGVEDVEPPGLHRDRSGLQRRVMGQRVDAARKARHDDETGFAQVAGQVPGHARAERRGIARADDGHGRAVQKRRIAQGPQDRRRVGDA